jgi:hypothetical protein
VIFLIGLGMLTFQGFATPAMLASGYIDVLGPEESFTFVPPTTTFCLPRLPAASHDYLLPLTTTCCLPRLPAATHDYLLPPTTTCSLPRLPAPSYNYLLPPTTTYSPPQLLAAFHDYLLLTSSPSLYLLREKFETPYPGLLLRRVTAQKAR